MQDARPATPSKKVTEEEQARVEEGQPRKTRKDEKSAINQWFIRSESA